MRSWIWWALGAVVAVGILAFVVLHRTNGTANAGADAAPSVALATVRYAGYDVTLDETGRVGAPAGTQAQLAFASPGILRNIYVHVGEHVSAGQALAALDMRPLALAAQQASADARAADAQAQAAAVDKYGTQLAVDRAALARSRHLYAAGVAAMKDVESARAQLASDEAASRGASAERIAAQAAAASAASRSELAATDLANATLRAPSAGVITAILHRPGEGVDSSTPVIALGPAAQGEVTLQVPSADAAQIAVGNAADIMLADGSAHARGHVTAVVPAVDPTTQAATVVLSGVPDGAVAGSAVRARITVAHVKGLLVPQSAVVADPQSGENVVFVRQRQKDGSFKFAERTVEIAHEDARLAEIRSGLRAGDRVAARGAFELLAPAGGGD
ncbi:MAG: efflux RND transporter periplasmic adaptor subunit [bacterium]|nr:efflux RND transporter periplasmic adaptor subunit [bacterium]